MARRRVALGGKPLVQLLLPGGQGGQQREGGQLASVAESLPKIDFSKCVEDRLLGQERNLNDVASSCGSVAGDSQDDSGPQYRPHDWEDLSAPAAPPIIDHQQLLTRMQQLQHQTAELLSNAAGIDLLTIALYRFVPDERNHIANVLCACPYTDAPVLSA